MWQIWALIPLEISKIFSQGEKQGGKFQWKFWENLLGGILLRTRVNAGLPSKDWQFKQWNSIVWIEKNGQNACCRDWFLAFSDSFMVCYCPILPYKNSMDCLGQPTYPCTLATCHSNPGQLSPEASKLTTVLCYPTTLPKDPSPFLIKLI